MHQADILRIVVASPGDVQAERNALATVVEELNRGLAARLGLTIESIDHPWKQVPLSLIGFQLRRMLGLSRRVASTSTAGIPINLFDAMRVVFRKPAR